ncbi:hypothetical protein B0H13DRAFT_1900494 [Mycena leptocephala]|nr:hypothetical protein B0H13DRAFT_1900494 [Mycena leptocephala]
MSFGGFEPHHTKQLVDEAHPGAHSSVQEIKSCAVESNKLRVRVRIDNIVICVHYGEISLAAPKELACGGRHTDTSTAIKSQQDQGAVGGHGVEDDPRSLAQPPQRQTNHRRLSAAEFGTKAPVGIEDVSQKEQQRRTEYGARNGRWDKMEVLVVHKDAGKERDAGGGNRDRGLTWKDRPKGQDWSEMSAVRGTRLGSALRTTAPPARRTLHALRPLTTAAAVSCPKRPHGSYSGCQRVSAAILLAAEVELDTGADADKADDDEGIKEVELLILQGRGNTLHDDTCAAASSAGGDGGADGTR